MKTSNLILILIVVTNLTVGSVAAGVIDHANKDKTLPINLNPDLYTQDIDASCNIYNPYPTDDETVKYIGKCVSGYAEGKGTVVWYKNGEFYQKCTGIFHHGKIDGKVRIEEESFVFVGNVKDSINNGPGAMTFTSGDKFVGNFLNGEKSGKGVYTWSTGGKYIGNYLNDEANGKGEYIGDDGKHYIGEYVNGSLHGSGKLTRANGEIYTGDFKKNAYSGQGTLIWPNGDRYIGSFLEGYRNGHGTFYYVNGDTFEGEWVYNKTIGVGTYTWSDGYYNKCIWKKDECEKLISKGTIKK